jgi:O-antigen/teichoic acid export membrane protein
MSLDSDQVPIPLHRNVVWTFLSNVVFACSQWGMLVVLAKAGSPVMVGEYGLGLAITAPIMLFATLGLRAVQATDVEQNFSFGSYFALRLVTTLVAVFVVAGVILTTGYGRHMALIIFAVAIAKGFELVSDVFYGAMQRHERMDRIAKSVILRGPLALVALAAGVLATSDVFWGGMAVAALWGWFAMNYDRRNATAVLRDHDHPFTDLGPLWNAAALRRLVLLSLPVGLTLMLFSLLTNIPRYFVDAYIGRRALGVYVALTYPLFALTTVVLALGQSATPRLANYAHTNRKAFETLLRRFLIMVLTLGATFALGAFLVGRPLLQLLYGPYYARHSVVFLWLVVASLFAQVTSCLGFTLTALRQFKIQPLLLGISCCICALLSFWLVPREGLLGAAWAYGVAILVQAMSFGACTLHYLTRSQRPRLIR